MRKLAGFYSVPLYGGLRVVVKVDSRGHMNDFPYYISKCVNPRRCKYGPAGRVTNRDMRKVESVEHR